MAKVRSIQNISFAVAVKRVEGASGHEGPMVVDRHYLQATDILQVKKVNFALFMAMVISGTAKVEKSLERWTSLWMRQRGS